MSSTPPATDSTPTARKVKLTGPEETLLATLYGRAQDANSPNPLLGDRWALQTTAKIDYDFASTGLTATAAASVALRARLLDTWTADFLAVHPVATVIHLGCGLDSRCERVQHGASVRWIDIDLPDTVALRRRLIPAPDGDYTLRAASATELDQWIETVPADRPTIAVFEGLSMYLEEEDAKRMLQGIVSRFALKGGQVSFDAYGSLAIRMQGWMKAVKNTGSELHWGIDDPKLLETWCPGLTLVEDLRSIDVPGISELPWSARMQASIVSHVPYLRNAGRMLRYKF